MTDCLFCKILAGDIPANKVYETERVLAFRDIDPKAPTHVLIIPKTHIATLNDVGPEHNADIVEIFAAAREIARQEDIAESGYRTVFNLYVLEGYKHQEIADMLGISINTSKSQLILAKEKMKQLLRKKGIV